MLLNHIRTQRRRAARRAAFTLLEVLIVVAILVILAGSASIAVFKYLEDAKEGRAKNDMRQIEQTLKKMYMESGGNTWPQPGDQGVAANMDQGVRALETPWGGQYTWTIINPDGQNERPLITCTTKSGKQLSWPER